MSVEKESKDAAPARSMLAARIFMMSLVAGGLCYVAVACAKAGTNEASVEAEVERTVRAACRIERWRKCREYISKGESDEQTRSSESEIE